MKACECSFATEGLLRGQEADHVSLELEGAWHCEAMCVGGFARGHAIHLPTPLMTFRGRFAPDNWSSFSSVLKEEEGFIWKTRSFSKRHGQISYIKAAFVNPSQRIYSANLKPRTCSLSLSFFSHGWRPFALLTATHFLHIAPDDHVVGEFRTHVLGLPRYHPRTSRSLNGIGRRTSTFTFTRIQVGTHWWRAVWAALRCLMPYDVRWRKPSWRNLACNLEMLDTSGRGKRLMKDGCRLHFCQIVPGLIERNLNGVAKMIVLWLVILWWDRKSKNGIY